MRTAGRLALLAAALLCAGCCLFRPSPPSRCLRPSTPDEVFIGLYSIVLRTAQLGNAAVTGWPPESPLMRASEFVRCDPDDARRPHRVRWAAVKLAVGITILLRTHGDPLVLDEFQKALLALGVSLDLADKLHASPAVTLPGLEDKAGEIIDQSHEPDLVALQRTCCPCLDDCQAGPTTNAAAVEFRVKANRSPQCLFHVIDPQCWAAVAGASFEQTFVVDSAPACRSCPPPSTDLCPVCRSGSVCENPLLTSPYEDVSAPPGARPWCGLLYERVKAQSSTFNVSSKYETVLGVRTKYPVPGATPPTADRFRMDYQLCESREHETCTPIGQVGCPRGQCAMTRDCGHALVYDNGLGEAIFDGSKYIHFTSGLTPDPNAWAPIALEVLAKESAISACIPASACSRAAAPHTCTSTPAPDKCACSRDHCIQQTYLIPKMPQPPLCP